MCSLVLLSTRLRRNVHDVPSSLALKSKSLAPVSSQTTASRKWRSGQRRPSVRFLSAI